VLANPDLAARKGTWAFSLDIRGDAGQDVNASLTREPENAEVAV
jgi:hypothetical protein